MSRYARVERLLRELETSCRRMVLDDSRTASLAEDVRCEIRRVEVSLERAPDEVLSYYDSLQLEETVQAIEPLLMELQLVTAPNVDGVTSSGARALGRYLPHLGTLHELLRP